MNNQHFDLDTLSAYLDGEVGASERALLETHLASCPACAATSRKLRSASSTLASLGSVQMTADEHRRLRQAVIGAAGSRAPASNRFRRLQWSLAGGLAVIAVAVAGFAALRPPGAAPDSSAESLTQAFDPADGAPLNFDSDDQVAGTVLALPEVVAARDRFRVEDGARSLAEAPAQAPAGGARDNAIWDSAPGPATRAAPESAEADSGDVSAPPAETGFSDPEGGRCLQAAALTTDRPLVALSARQATFQGRPAWLLVYATTSDPLPGRVLDEIQTFLVDPVDCATLSGDALDRAILSRSTLDQP